MKSLDELIDTEDPGIDLLREWAGSPSANQNVLLPADPSLRGPALERLQVTTRSLLGAVVYETGGVIVDHGWLRVFGSSASRSFWAVNDAAGEAAKGGGALLIADDIFGGLFALNGGLFGQDELGHVFHLSADDTKWGSLEVGHTDFIEWCLTGDLSLIDSDLRKGKLAALERRIDIDKVYSFYPFLWTSEGRSGSGDVRLVDANESLRLRIDLLGYEMA